MELTGKPNKRRFICISALCITILLSFAVRAFSADYSRVSHVPIGTKVSSQDKWISLELIARFQHYNPKADHPADHYDRDIYSPKSVFLSASNNKAYVNSLEGASTVIYDREALLKKGLISHKFDRNSEALFRGDINPGDWDEFPAGFDKGRKDIFRGKPVEFAETHSGKYLWIPYYRRSFDNNGILPSAVAVVDTKTEEIQRVIETGPVPKMLASSPDGKWLAVIHWGDNTVGFIDVSPGTPQDFKRDFVVSVEKKYKLKAGDKEVNRDSDCGYCLRGAAFTKDGHYLLVGRMKGGGIAVIDVMKRIYIGTVYGMKPTPRHLVMSGDGTTLYLSSNYSGYVSSYKTQEIVDAAIKGRKSLKPDMEVFTGRGARTISLSPDDKTIFVAVKNGSMIKAIDVASMKIIAEIPTDSYPVGMAISPDGGQLWVTAQGFSGVGGNSVSVYRISYRRE